MGGFELWKRPLAGWDFRFLVTLVEVSVVLIIQMVPSHVE